MLLILAGVTISSFTGQESIIDNAEEAVEGFNNKVIEEQVALNEIRDYIKNDGNVEEANGITISVVPNTTGATRKVILTIAATSEDGIKSLTSNAGMNKTYTSGTKEILETCEITENGIYTFTVENEKGKKASRGILIGNILEGTIQIVADKTMPTKDNVKITITWPEGSDSGIKEIKIGNGTWQSASGSTSVVEVTENCTVEARVRNGEEDVIASSITISNIDKNNPIVTATAGTETIKEGDSNEISKYFTYSANGTAEITSVTYTDTSNGNAIITNTNTLSIGTHAIKCTVTKATGLSASATKTIVIEQKDTTPPTLEISFIATGFGSGRVSVVSVSDDVAMPENPIYSYYFKTEDETEYTLYYSGPETEYDASLSSGSHTDWDAKVEVADAVGNIGSATKTCYITQCFVAGTQVLTESGFRNIEDIQIGEMVYAIDIDTNERTLKRVLNIFRGETDEAYEITIGEETVTATPKHQFYIIDKGWTRAYDLEVGDMISAKDCNMEITQINHILYKEPIPVYNLEVDDFHTFLVTKYELLVHNFASPLHSTGPEIEVSIEPIIP